MMGPKNIERLMRYMECGWACTVVRELNFSFTGNTKEGWGSNTNGNTKLQKRLLQSIASVARIFDLWRWK